jgi:transposase
MRVWLAVGRTDMRRGMNGLSLQVQETLGRDPFAGDLFVFRGARGDLVKILWHDGLGLSLYAKRLERGRFVWPSANGGSVAISAAQLTYMLDGIDWVTRFTHSDRNARDRPFHRAFFAGGRRGSVIPSPHGFAT